MTITWTTTVSRMVWRASDDPLITWAVQVGQDTGTGGGNGGVTDHGALTGLADNDHPQYQLVSARNQPNGYAGLDAQGTIPDIRIPSSIARDTEVSAAVAAAVSDLVGAAPSLLDTLDELAAALGDDPTFAATVTAALAGKQTASSTLTLLAALTTTSYGRALLELADAAAARTALGLGNSATRAVGTTTGTVAAGDDSRITGAVPSSRQIAGLDLTADRNAAALRGALGSGTPGSDNFLRGDGQWATPAGSSSPFGGSSSFGGNRAYQLPGVIWDSLANAIALGADTIRYVPFLIRAGTLSVDRIHAEVTTLAASSSIRVGVYAADSSWQPTGAALIDATASAATTGSKAMTVSATLPPGRYLACIVANGAVSVRAGAARPSWGTDHSATAVTTPSSAQLITNRRVALTYPASLPNSGPAWTTIDTSATNTAGDPLILLRGTMS